MSVMSGFSLSVTKRVVGVVFLGMLLAMASANPRAYCGWGEYSDCNTCDAWTLAPYPRITYSQCTFDCSNAVSRCQSWCGNMTASMYYDSCNWEPDTEIGSGECNCHSW